MNRQTPNAGNGIKRPSLTMAESLLTMEQLDGIPPIVQGFILECAETIPTDERDGYLTALYNRIAQELRNINEADHTLEKLYQIIARANVDLLKTAMQKASPLQRGLNLDQKALQEGIHVKRAPLFIDINGFTAAQRAAEKAGQNEKATAYMREIWERINAVMEKCEGKNFNTAGDGALYYFAEPETALEAGIEIQSSLEKNPILLRIGKKRQEARVKIAIGWGELDGSFMNFQTLFQGTALNKTARVESVAQSKGGCIVLEEAVEQIRHNKNDDDFESYFMKADRVTFDGLNEADDPPTTIYALRSTPFTGNAIQRKKYFEETVDQYLLNNWNTPPGANANHWGAKKRLEKMVSHWPDPAAVDILHFMNSVQRQCAWALNFMVENGGAQDFPGFAKKVGEMTPQMEAFQKRVQDAPDKKLWRLYTGQDTCMYYRFVPTKGYDPFSGEEITEKR